MYKRSVGGVLNMNKIAINKSANLKCGINNIIEIEKHEHPTGNRKHCAESAKFEKHNI